MSQRGALALAAAMMLSACANGAPPVASADRCRPDAASLDSRAGRAWMRDNGWRYTDAGAARTAYEKLLRDASPWPDWVAPVPQTLPAGTRFEMALAPGQGVDRPGGFGTFDRIAKASDVRHYLAVRRAWKPVVDRVVTYEVTQPLPVATGPVGPQIDPASCRLLTGRWSQFQMQVPAAERMRYIRVIATRPLR